MKIPVSINFRGKLLRPAPVWIMGILNVTPDSFSDGGKFLDAKEAILQAEKLLTAGADILDIGGASSRPGASFIEVEEEWKRVEPVIVGIRKSFPEAIISLDTWRASVAQRGLAEGVDMINDISAGQLEPEILAFTAQANAPYIAMHMQGTPLDMQENPAYQDVAKDVLEFLALRTNIARSAGIKDVILDPGFGFGKTLEHNYSLFRNLPAFVQTGQAIAIGISKKSMLTRLVNASRDEVSDLSSILHYQAMEAGVAIIRVHDPKPVVQARTLFTYLNKH